MRPLLIRGSAVGTASILVRWPLPSHREKSSLSRQQVPHTTIADEPANLLTQLDMHCYSA